VRLYGGYPSKDNLFLFICSFLLDQRNTLMYILSTTTTKEQNNMNAQELNKTFNSLNPNTMIRISDKPLYACLNNTQRAIKLWDSAGFDTFGGLEEHGEDLYFATTKNYTIVILLNKRLDSEFCQLASAAKALIELSGNPEKHAKVLKNCFDAWQ
jgi:hypothetical protein